MTFDSYTQRIDDLMQEWAVPGLAISVVQGDDTLHQSAHGHADRDAQTPVTPDTRFPIASMSKSFTAMMIALLVEDGELEWDKPVRHYMPEFKLKDSYATEHITVRDMLSHRTGLPRHDWSVWREDISLSELIDRMQHLEFFATFREKWYYNNLMYYACAYLVEKISGQRWQDFMQQRIFAPLGMTGTNLSPFEDIPGFEIAQGYRAKRDEQGVPTGEQIHLPFGPVTDVSPGAAGALVSTLADVVTWLKVHVNSGRHGDEQFISANNLQQMHNPHSIMQPSAIQQHMFGHNIFLYGLGWFIEPYRNFTLVHHGGNVEGHSTIMGFVPGPDVGVVVLTNAAGTPLRDLLLYDAIDRAVGKVGKDWNATYHGVYDEAFKAMEQGKVTSAGEQIENAPPSHPLSDYTGTFAADGYGDFEVRETDDGTLQAQLGTGFPWSAFEHYHYDVFNWYWPDFDNYTKVRFLMNEQGELDKVSMQLEPAIEEPIVFTRKSLALSDDLLAAMTGTYDPPYEGMQVAFYARDGKLYLEATGDTPDEVRAVKVTDAAVMLRNKQHATIRYEFVREGDAITKMVMKSPGATLECPRLAE
jgi:CubicO group peptidase (beta-lactamase class C family)